MTINYDGIPGYMEYALWLYIENGIIPGSFLTAVLSNNLMGALGKADEVNQRALHAYGRFLYNRAPCGCYGSPEAVAAWCKVGGLNGLRATMEGGDA